MYVCIYVRTYVCIMYVCICIGMNVRKYICMYVCMYVCMYYVCICIGMNVRNYVCMYVCMYVPINSQNFMQIVLNILLIQ